MIVINYTVLMAVSSSNHCRRCAVSLSCRWDYWSRSGTICLCTLYTLVRCVLLALLVSAGSRVVLCAQHHHQQQVQCRQSKEASKSTDDSTMIQLAAQAQFPSLVQSCKTISKISDIVQHSGDGTQYVVAYSKNCSTTGQGH